MVLTMTELNQHKLRQLNDWILTCPLCPNHDKKVCQVSQTRRGNSDIVLSDGNVEKTQFGTN